MDWMWLLLGGALVFFMHSGFALLEVGSVSVRNTQNILFKNVVSPTVSAVLFWAFGYSVAYVRSPANFISAWGILTVQLTVRAWHRATAATTP